MDGRFSTIAHATREQSRLGRPPQTLPVRSSWAVGAPSFRIKRGGPILSRYRHRSVNYASAGMRGITSDIFVQCLQVLLLPVVRFGVRHSVKVQDAIELVKILYLQVASEEIQKHSGEANISRLSALTGLHRRDVVRIFRYGETKQQGVGVTYRVIGRWQSDRRFTSQSGKPRVLSTEGPDSDFRRLMDSVATDLKPGTVLFELERTGAVERVKHGVRLRVQAFEVHQDPIEGFRMLADDTDDLLHSVEDNLLAPSGFSHLHGKTVYDNLPAHTRPEISEWLIREAARFHARVRRHLSRFDLDLHPSASQRGGGRVAFGTFARLTTGRNEPTSGSKG